MFKPPPSAADAVSIAVGAYDGFGKLSVPPEFRAHAKVGYRSRVSPLTAKGAVPRLVSGTQAVGIPAGEVAANKPDIVAYDRLTLSLDPTQEAPETGLELVLPTDESLAALAEKYSPSQLTERKHQILRERLRNPDEDVWLIRDADGNVGGFSCVSWVDHYEAASNYWMRLEPHQFLFIDDLVFKDHRRRGMQRYSIQRRAEIARDRGRTEGVLLIRSDNIASRSSFLSLGAEYAGRLHFSRKARQSVLVPEPDAALLRQEAGQL